MKKEDLSVRYNKGVSEIVSYTLLIIIAIGASIMVYAFLNALINRPTVTCPNDIYLIIKDYSCSYRAGELNITFVNKGRFSINAAYVRVGNVTRSTRFWINNEGSTSFYFMGVNNGLAPNQETTWSFDLSTGTASKVINASGEYILEIQPAMYDKDLQKTAACDSIVSQQITC